MQDINLYRLLNFYVKKWPWIVLLTIFGALAGFVYNNYIQVPLYKSDATLLIVDTDSVKTPQDSTLINNYIQLLKSRRVLEPVIKEQNSDMSYDELVGSTTATNEKNTEVIKVSIASKDAEMSKKLVEGVVVSFRDEVKNLYKRDNISIVDNASQATEPYNVHTAILIALTTAAGLLSSLIIFFFAYDVSLTREKTKDIKGMKTTKAKAQPKSPLKPRAKAQPKKKVVRKSVAQTAATIPKAVAKPVTVPKPKAKAQPKATTVRKKLIKSIVTLLVDTPAAPVPKKKTAARTKTTNRKK